MIEFSLTRLEVKTNNLSEVTSVIAGMTAVETDEEYMEYMDQEIFVEPPAIMTDEEIIQVVNACIQEKDWNSILTIRLNARKEAPKVTRSLPVFNVVVGTNGKHTLDVSKVVFDSSGKVSLPNKPDTPSKPDTPGGPPG